MLRAVTAKASVASLKLQAAADAVANRCEYGGTLMAWTTPLIVEICVGMEITSYESAEI